MYMQEVYYETIGEILTRFFDFGFEIDGILYFNLNSYKILSFKKDYSENCEKDIERYGRCFCPINGNGGNL